MHRMLFYRFCARNEFRYIALQTINKNYGKRLGVSDPYGETTIMAYGPSVIAPRELSYREASTKLTSRRGLLHRIFDAMMASRQRQVDREIARYLAGAGGTLTDDAERKIERRLLSTPSSW